VDGAAVGVLRPGAVAFAHLARARRGYGLSTVEGARDVVVGRTRARRSVRVGETQVADREAQVVEPVEHAGEWGSGVLVDDELTGVDAVVEPPVHDGQYTKVGERHGATLLPDSAGLQLCTNGSGHRPDRRMKRRDRERDERNESETHHCFIQ